jgi:CRISPR-associated protein Csc2
MKEKFLKQYQNLPTGNYISIVVLRRTESETIFRTEGAGESLCTEKLNLNGINSTHLVMTKRKQIAVERRTGRELLRNHKMDKGCKMNTTNPCGECIDCFVYGYAVGGGGAQKSRILTDDAFSLQTFAQATDRRTFNALYDNGTMRDPDTGKASSSLNYSEYIKPGTYFLEIETLKDVTYEEFLYVLGNIMTSTRYGAISSRIGRVSNHILAITHSKQELFSNWELLEKTLSLLEIHTAEDYRKLDSLSLEEIKAKAVLAVKALAEKALVPPYLFTSDEVGEINVELAKYLKDPLINLHKMDGEYQNIIEMIKKNKEKEKKSNKKEEQD